MTIKIVSRRVLVCDGCGVEFGDVTGFENTQTAHCEAYAAGWRFPSKTTQAGLPVASTSDVCPACVEGWTPVVDGRSLRLR